MQDKAAIISPESFSLITYAWVIGIAALGGFVNFTRKFKEGHKKIFNVFELIGELATSAFAGMLTFYLCQHKEIDPLVTAAVVGISGHSASRTLGLIQSWVDSKFPLTIKEKE